MDHRVSKDMISSGMTPSGDKSQSDLGRTQYGSAPSPNRLMDAYHSMYENQKEETLEEGAGLYANIHAKRKRGGKMRKKGDKGAPSSQDFANAAKTAREDTDLLAAYQSIYTDTFEEGKIPAGLQAYLDKKKGKKKDDDGDEKKDKKVVKEFIERIKGIPKGKPLSPKKAFGNLFSKTKQLNLKDYKPASGIESDPSKLPKQLNLTYDKPVTNKDIKRDKLLGIMNRNEGADLYDIISEYFLSEGYNEKDVNHVLVELSDDLKDLEEAAPLLALAPLLAKAGAALKATKVGAAALKGGAAFKKGVMTSKAAGAASKITTTGGKTIGGTVNKVGKLERAGQLTRQAGAAMKNNPLNTMIGAQMAGSMMPGGGAPQPRPSANQNKARVVSADADLFDIVKGQLLDEGCTEEEVNEIMTTLTLDEINETLQLDEISGKLAMKASRAADMKRAELAKAGDKKGAADKAAQATRLYKAGAKKNIASTDYSKPLNPQRTDYPMGKGANYQQKPNM